MANILVCDDDKDIVEAIGIYLEQEGYTVIKAYDGVEAINVLRSQPVDLLIIDIMMPKLDGIRTTLKIREENPLQPATGRESFNTFFLRNQRMQIRSLD